MRHVIRLLLLCLVVGLVLAFFDISPQSIITDTWAAIRDVGELVWSFVAWAVPYILLGAVVVVPVAVISYLVRATNRDRG